MASDKEGRNILLLQVRMMRILTQDTHSRSTNILVKLLAVSVFWTQRRGKEFISPCAIVLQRSPSVFEPL